MPKLYLAFPHSAIVEHEGKSSTVRELIAAAVGKEPDLEDTLQTKQVDPTKPWDTEVMHFLGFEMPENPPTDLLARLTKLGATVKVE